MYAAKGETKQQHCESVGCSAHSGYGGNFRSISVYIRSRYPYINTHILFPRASMSMGLSLVHDSTKSAKHVLRYISREGGGRLSDTHHHRSLTIRIQHHARSRPT